MAHFAANDDFNRNIDYKYEMFLQTRDLLYLK